MKNRYRMFVVVILATYLPLLALFSGCDGDETKKKCQACPSANAQYDFEKKYLRYITNLDGTARLVEYDTVNDITTQYKICYLEQLEERKIIKAEGTVFSACENEPENILNVEKFEIVNYCSSSLKVVAGDFDLLGGKWHIYSVSTIDTLLYVPCESTDADPYMQFSETAITGFAGTNEFICNYTQEGTNQFKMAGCAISLFTGTDAEVLFENAFGQTLDETSLLTYIIENNVLEIKNPLNNSSIKLYKK